MNKFLELDNLSTKDRVSLLIDLLKDPNQAVVIKTDTVYGIISKSPETIGKAKLRDIQKKKIVQFISKTEHIEVDLPKQLIEILNRFWPGPLTLIYKQISYRIPKHNLLLSVIDKIGPVYASSANITNNPVVQNIKQAQEEFKNSQTVIYFVEENSCEKESNNIASTIFNWDNLEVIREGPISKKEILEIMEQNNS